MTSCGKLLQFTSGSRGESLFHNDLHICLVFWCCSMFRHSADSKEASVLSGTVQKFLG